MKYGRGTKQQISEDIEPRQHGISESGVTIGSSNKGSIAYLPEKETGGDRRSSQSKLKPFHSPILMQRYIPGPNGSLVERQPTHAMTITPSPHTPDIRHITLPGMRTLSALLTNGDILRINCRTFPHKPAIYVPPHIPTPPALAPTTMQSQKPHLPYIDIIPFSSLRDSLLRASEVVSTAEFWSDMVSNVRVWGMTPWDRRGWEVQESFAMKWWWLITEEVLEETNFWRVSRGQKPLFLESLIAGAMSRV